MKIWITKYALTKGILCVDAEEGYDASSMMIYEDEIGHRTYVHGEGREWHMTLDSAVTKANDMKCAKINSLKKQLKKLEALEF